MFLSDFIIQGKDEQHQPPQQLSIYIGNNGNSREISVNTFPDQFS